MIERSANHFIAATSAGSWFFREQIVEPDNASAFISGKPAFSDGKWWIPGRLMLHSLGADGFEPSILYQSYGIKGFVHQAIWRTPSELWLATKEDGLVAIRFSKSGFTLTRLLDIKEVSGLAQDVSGTIWVSTLRNGLFKFHYWFDRFTEIESVNGIRLDKTVFAADFLVVSEFNGTFQRNKSGAFSNILQGPTHFAEATIDNKVVVGQIDKAYIVSEDGKRTDIERIAREAGYVIQHPIKDSYTVGRDIALSAPNGVYVMDGISETLRRVYPGRSTSVVLLDSHRIVVGRPNQLEIINRMDGSVIRAVSYRVTAIKKVDSNILLVGTNGDGLIRFDSNKGEGRVLIPGAWSTLQRVKERVFAIVGAAGLFIVEFDEQATEFKMKEIPLTPIGFAQQVRHVRLSEDGILWLSTSNGILKTNLDVLMKPSPSPQLRISEINSEGIEMLPTDTLQLSRESERISIAIGILGEMNPHIHKLEYTTGVIDSTSSWLPLSQPSIEIESIRKGQTSFHFRLRNVLTDETVSSVSLLVIKKPYWYELPWVIALAIVLALGATVIMTTLTLRHSHRRRMDVLAQEDRMREFERIAVTRLLTSHYLFNALATIRSVARRSTDEVNSYIGRLSKVIRALIDRTSQNEVDLQSELEWIRDYLALESVGRQIAIDFRVSVDESLDLEDIHLPAFILQPIVENALVHGALYQDAVIHCDITSTNNQLRISIRNTINADSTNPILSGSSSRGLTFMTERLKGWGRYHGLQLDTNQVLSIQRTDTEWTTVLSLPFVN